MKKASVFIFIVVFLLSIFVINFYGLSVRTDHMKRYVNDVEITGVSLANDGTWIDYDWFGKGDNRRKVVKIDISKQEMPFGIYIEYEIKPEDIGYENFEFAIDSDVGTYPATIIDDEGHEVIVDMPRATINSSTGLMNRNLITVYAECSFRVVLRSTDGSVQSDTINLWCLDLSEGEE